MDSDQYVTIELGQVSLAIEDLLTGELFEAGAQGVQEDLQFTQAHRQYKPTIVDQEVKTLIAYFLQKPPASFFDKLLSQFPQLQVSVNNHPVKDWLSEWKNQWQAFKLIQDVWVVPDWEKNNFPKEQKKIIYIEPGMAFGTGTHETTQIASQLLTNLLTQVSVSSLLDVGTGSGILVLLAKLYGIDQLYAFDNDFESKRVFFENMEKNNLPNIQWVENWSYQLEKKVEVTVANIIDGVLLDLKANFKTLASRYYIFTGVLVEREQLFIKEMLQDWPLNLRSRVQQGEWVGFCFEALV